MNKKLTLLSVLALSACGTVFSTTTQNISFDADVKDVSVYIDGAFVCRTPCSYPVERHSGTLMVTGKKDGYEDLVMPVRSKLNPAAFGNLLSVYSWTTDFVDGAVWKYSQDGIYLNMKPSNMTQKAAAKFHQDTQTRRFAMINFGESKAEEASHSQGEYTQALIELSSQEPSVVQKAIHNAQTEIQLAHHLTGIIE